MKEINKLRNKLWLGMGLSYIAYLIIGLSMVLLNINFWIILGTSIIYTTVVIRFICSNRKTLFFEDETND